MTSPKSRFQLPTVMDVENIVDTQAGSSEESTLPEDIIEKECQSSRTMQKRSSYDNSACSKSSNEYSTNSGSVEHSVVQSEYSSSNVCQHSTSRDSEETTSTSSSLFLNVSAGSGTFQGNGFSPTTPTSRFSKYFLEGIQSNYVIAAALCNWDNIFGPRIRYLWVAKDLATTNFTVSLLNFVASQILSGEITRDPCDPILEKKIYMSAEKGVIVAAFVFGAMSRKDMAIHSVIVILSYEHLQQFLQWKDICFEWLHRSVLQLRICLATNVKQGLEIFKNSFIGFILVIESLQYAGVPTDITLNETNFNPERLTETEFLRKSLAAHLCQCQQSILIGKSIDKVNNMVRTLSFFMMSHHRHRCRRLPLDGNVIYAPEICVQGLLKTEDQMREIVQSVYQSLYPSALIDVDTEEVFVLCRPREHALKREKFVNTSLQRLWNESPPATIPSIRDTFQSMNFSETLVDQLLKQLFRLPLTHGIRESYIHHFMNGLKRQALALIQGIETEMRCQTANMDEPSSLLSGLRRSLSLELECDFMIVLSIAELVKPGVIGLVSDRLSH